MTTDANFQTTDLSLAAFLLARGHRLSELGGVPRGRRVFAFPIEAAAEAFEFFQHASVPARAFANALRDLKALIRQS
jgi:hypothetical protein